MASVEIAVTIPLLAHLQEKIEAVDRRVRLTVLPPVQRYLLRAGRPSPRLYADPQPSSSPAEAAAEQARLDATLAETEVLMTTMWAVPQDLLERAPHLRWLQISAAGLDRLLGHPVFRSSVTVTSASGIHAVPIGEYILAYMLYFAKELPRFLESQRQRRWQPAMVQELHGHTVGILGLGSIGREVARLAKALNMRVLAIRRSAGEGERSPLVDELLTPAQLDYLLAESDYLLLSLPLTTETRGLIGERELRTMKPSACLINIARGEIVDSGALARALREGWIAAAALDVTTPEPLPAESELWQLPNLIITPHITPSTDRYVERVVDLFCENLRRYLAGDPLLNVIDLARGY